MLERARMYGIRLRRSGFLTQRSHAARPMSSSPDRADEVVRGAVEDAAEPARRAGMFCNSASCRATRRRTAQIARWPRPTGVRPPVAKRRLAVSRPVEQLEHVSEPPRLEVQTEHAQPDQPRLTKLGEPSLQVLERSRGHSRGARRGATPRSVGMEATTPAPRFDPIRTCCSFTRSWRTVRPTCGWLRLLFLTVNGQRIATSYGAHYQDRLFLLQDRLRPRVREVCAVQAADLLRDPRRLRRWLA